MAAQQPLSNTQAPLDVYGGDEVSAIVLDAGYCHTRAGFAGEDVPKSVLPSFYGSLKSTNTDSTTTTYRDLFGDEYIIPRENLEIKNYMSRSESIVEDWDTATKIWEDMLIRRLQPDQEIHPSKNGLNDPADGEGDVTMDDAAENQEKPLAENPLLMTEAPWNTGKAREKAIEIAMENWGCPAFWLSRTPVLAAFAAGKASALVIDVGGANTSVTAIHDGMILKRSIQKSSIGGLWLSSQVKTMWENNDPRINITPSYLVESKTPVDAGAPAQAKIRTFPFEVTPSFRAYEDERLLTEYKESVVEVWRGPGRYLNPGNEDLVRSQPGRVFEMPDGSNQMWREQRYRVSEGMWDENAALPTPDGGKVQTIPEMIRACLNAVDVDLRPNLLGNVVVTGGTSLLNGFNDRLNNELMAMHPGMKIKLHAAGLTTERRFGAWIGGSILASLGTFHQMWISRKEYEENGAGIVEKRCK
ncbi:chromatin remodeling and histone acetyltransferase complexes subunit putative [Xylariaceae sp. FL0255]|nr:chromatin remodeling and histone acetyltransferase complexes subunit putative [Xylariaceae sp. FL0255]